MKLIRPVFPDYFTAPFLNAWNKSELSKDTAFFICLGATGTSDVEGISAAGGDPPQRRLTPCADAEALVLGKTISTEKIPVSPVGIVSPVVVTRACLQLVGIEPEIVDCGTFVKPKIEMVRTSGTPALCVSTASALPVEVVETLLVEGRELGKRIASSKKNLVVGECVPGGTTTALACLTALGIDARNQVSSSHPISNHDLKWLLVDEGQQRLAERSAKIMSPIDAVAAFGDSMQAFVMGMIIGATEGGCSVMLGGGSQMLCVYALVSAYNATLENPVNLQSVVVATTKWVAFDKSAQTASLSASLGAPLVASCPDFSRSRHPGLQAYEFGNVKEGMGAGAAMTLASLCGFEYELILERIDDVYDELTKPNLVRT